MFRQKNTWRCMAPPNPGRIFHSTWRPSRCGVGQRLVKIFFDDIILYSHPKKSQLDIISPMKWVM